MIVNIVFHPLLSIWLNFRFIWGKSKIVIAWLGEEDIGDGLNERIFEQHRL